MNSAMNDAMDLYAWAVETCQAKGYPLGAVRVRWSADIDSGVECHYAEWNGREWCEDELLAQDRFNLYGPEGVTLAIDEGEAETLGLRVTLEPGPDDVQVVVRLQPSHEWKSGPPHQWVIGGRDCIGFEMMCYRCGREERFVYPSDTPAYDFDQLMEEYKRTPYRALPSTEGHIPACVIRHHIVVRTSVAAEGHTAVCTQCNGGFPLPPRTTAQTELRGSRYFAFDITEEYVRSLGRCRGRIQ